MGEYSSGASDREADKEISLEEGYMMSQEDYSIHRVLQHTLKTWAAQIQLPVLLSAYFCDFEKLFNYSVL